MTSKLNTKGELTEDEWEEMKALKNAINEAPHTVSPDKMEQFTSYLVRSMKERGG
jgi:hypothetical protein